jgi:hypothetical protein
MPIDTILRESHSGWRWLVVLAFLLVAIRYTIGLIQGGALDKLAERFMLAFTIMVTIQWVLGIIYALYYWATIAFVGDHIPHLLGGTLAVGLVHMARSRFGKTGQDAYLGGLLATLGTGLVIFVTVILLPGGISRWAM